jgi:hypothetical protein
MRLAARARKDPTATRMDLTGDHSDPVGPTALTPPVMHGAGSALPVPAITPNRRQPNRAPASGLKSSAQQPLLFPSH